MSKTKKIILSALLLAILLVFSRFISIKTPILVISLSFLPIMISAILLGPKYSCIIALLGDLIGALLFPFGSYFVGFTIEQALVGIIYGLFLYKKPNISEFDNAEKTSTFLENSNEKQNITDSLTNSSEKENNNSQENDSQIEQHSFNEFNSNQQTLFYHGKSFIIRLILSSFIVLEIIELPCMSLMLHLLYGKAFLAVLSSRLLAKVVLFPIQIIIIFFLTKVIEPLAKKYLYNDD
jgi:ECF transporter S component (folate family)